VPRERGEEEVGGGEGGGGGGDRDDSRTSSDDDVDVEVDDDDVLYNALVVVAADGTVLTRYHKTHLYVVDETWASEGSGFVSVPIPVRDGAGGESGEVRSIQHWSPYDRVREVNADP
jgi:hypothetical protein